jgi:hypothetical protein
MSFFTTDCLNNTMPHFSTDPIDFPGLLERREFLGQMGTGLGSIALACMLADEAGAAGKESAAGNPLAPHAPHFAPRAKRVIQIFCPGAVSQIDTFEYKPELIKRHGQPMPGQENLVTFQGGNGSLMRSPWDWRQYGKSGKWVSSLLPHLAECVDEIAFVHSLTARSNTHGPAMLQMNTGFVVDGFPSMGAWTTYALGTANQDLPAFVAIPDVRGLPPNGPGNWGAGFLPAAFQGTAFNTERPIANLSPPPGITPEADRDTRGFLSKLNSRYMARHAGHSDLAARIAAYELAARMQLSAPEVTDLSRETPETIRLYGADSGDRLKASYARNCILARRLVERGVRFIQVYCGASASAVDGLLNWDAHKTLKADYERHCPIMDQPTAALLIDLKRRGLLADTLLLWTTEFGRMPTHQTGAEGRDHNPNGFTSWMAGAGVKGGFSYGATDEFGYKAQKDVCTIYDFHATVLRLLGLDHKRLTFYHNGAERRLTDVHGEVLTPLLA